MAKLLRLALALLLTAIGIFQPRWIGRPLLVVAAVLVLLALWQALAKSPLRRRVPTIIGCTVIAGILVYAIPLWLDSGPSNSGPPEPTQQPNNVVINAPQGIGISGGTVNNPTVNNFGPPPPKISWLPVDMPQPEGATRPRSFVKLSLDHAMESAKFAVICDRPCNAVGTRGVPGYSQIAYGKIPDHRDVAVFVVNAPNPFPPDTEMVLEVESEDEAQVRIIGVRRFVITNLNPQITGG